MTSALPLPFNRLKFQTELVKRIVTDNPPTEKEFLKEIELCNMGAVKRVKYDLDMVSTEEMRTLNPKVGKRILEFKALLESYMSDTEVVAPTEVEEDQLYKIFDFTPEQLNEAIAKDERSPELDALVDHYNKFFKMKQVHKISLERARSIAFGLYLARCFMEGSFVPRPTSLKLVAKVTQGSDFEFYTSDTGQPFVYSSKTKKTFTLAWDSILKIAKVKGILNTQSD